jgi:protein gp37
MGKDSKIEWTHHTFNPWRGCAKVSAGCANCYAETLSHRNPAVLGEWGPNGTRVIASESMWREPVRWNREAAAAGERRRVFCASLADVFEDRPELQAPRARLYEMVIRCDSLDWLLLTKRPENAARLWAQASTDVFGDMYNNPPIWSTNVWLGTSVEDQRAADERIPHLLKVPAAVRFLSCEPMLGEVGLYRGGWLFLRPPQPPPGSHTYHGRGIDWVICGGESGPNARPMHPRWAQSLRNQCAGDGVPFFFKQWGEWDSNGRRVGKSIAGRLLDGVEHSEFPHDHTTKGLTNNG